LVQVGQKKLLADLPGIRSPGTQYSRAVSNPLTLTFLQFIDF